MQRGSGVLLAISSLPGPDSVGTLGAPAYAFIDQLVRSGQRYWQILPLGQAGYGDSPYQSLSSFAGSVDYIDPELLAEAGLLTRAEIADFRQSCPPPQTRQQWHRRKLELLWLAFVRGREQLRRELADFGAANDLWLPDYSLYMAIREQEQDAPPSGWPAALRQRQPAELLATALRLAERIRFYRFLQYLFFQQWQALREYANRQGVAIIGDLPLYLSPDGVEAWAQPELFDPQGRVAGCPPDYFSPDGQLWGNPLYDWPAMAADGYRWWRRRIAWQLQLFDYLRLDHFRGFESYYAIPAQAVTAADGQWLPGPGLELFRLLRQDLGQLPLIAEDLGTLTPSFFDFRRDCGLPGLAVLEFAFTPGENSSYLPHNLQRETIVYTGTHDNDVVRSWFSGLSAAERRFVRAYLGPVSADSIAAALCRTAQASVADVCILPLQDVLGLGVETRMNTPGTVGGRNWQWRLKPGQFDRQAELRLRAMAETFHRIW